MVAADRPGKVPSGSGARGYGRVLGYVVDDRSSRTNTGECRTISEASQSVEPHPVLPGTASTGDPGQPRGAARPVELSVVIACLDAADTIGEQLDVLAAQTCPVGWELLLCDNGSTDATRRIAGGYAGRLPLAVVDASERRGPSAARNRGAALARGRWLAFCDADDVVADDWLERMVTALREHDFVAGRFEATRLNDAATLRSRHLDQQEGLQATPDLLDLPHAGAGNMGVRRDLFARVGGFDLTLTCLEDTDLSWRVQREGGASLHYAPDVVVHVRLRSRLAGIYRQGHAYGVAHAELEARIGVRRAGTARPGAGRLARAREAVCQVCVGRRPSLGRALWQLGWHRGHHQGIEVRRMRPAQARSGIQG